MILYSFISAIYNIVCVLMMPLKVVNAPSVTRYRNKSEENLLNYADQSRKADRFTDVYIKAGNISFPAHRLILGCYSSFFERLFESPMKEQDEGIVNLKDLDGEAVRLLIDYMYVGSISINEENVLNIMVAAHFLQINEVYRFCFDFLKTAISMDNWSTILSILRLYENDSIIAQFHHFFTENLNAMSQSKYFKELPIKDLVVITQNLDRFIIRETSLYEAIVSWICYDKANRKSELSNLFLLLDLSKLPSDFLKNIVASDPLIQGNAECIKKVMSEIAKKFKLTQSKSKLIGIAGNFGSRNVVEVYNCKRKSTSVYPQLPTPAFNSKTLQLNDFIYTIGGRLNLNTFDARNKIYRMNLKDAELKWKEVCPMNEGRCRMGAAVFMDFLVVAGGENNNNNYLSTVEFYNPALNKWQQTSKLNHFRSQTELVVCNGRLYAVGGDKKEGILSSVERLNDLNEKWQEVKSMSFSRMFFATISHNGVIYAIGGLREDDAGKPIVLQSVEKYDPVENKWTFVSNLIHARYGHAACLLRDKIYVVGGAKANRKTIKYIECYDPSTDRWTVVGEIKNNLFDHTVVAL